MDPEIDQQGPQPGDDQHEPSAESASTAVPEDTAIQELLAELERAEAAVAARLASTDTVTASAKELLEGVIRFADAVAADREGLEREKASLVLRAQELSRAEGTRDAGYADERAKLDAELVDRRRALDAEVMGRRRALDEEFSSIRATRLAEVAAAEDSERARVRAAIEAERAEWDARRQHAEAAIAQLRMEVEAQRGAVTAAQSALEGRRLELEGLESEVEAREARARRQAQRRADNLQAEVDELVAERKKTFESQLQSALDAAADLRATLRSQDDLVAAFDSLNQQLGDQDPASIIRMLNSKTDEITRLREELATRPTEEMQERYEALHAEYRRLLTQTEQQQQQISANAQLVSQQQEFQRQNNELKQTNASLGRLNENLEAHARQLQADLDRLRAAYERPAEVEARHNEIEHALRTSAEIQETPGATLLDRNRPRDNAPAVDEGKWLDGIAEACEDYGLHFNPRILKAFHTSLKTAEWSPLTVLAGVSGTGKSELPRLYSHFGGLFYESLAVQPNWDSQESMLGFFNSIDNRFDAQPVLRFLAQSQKVWSPDYPGLADAVSLVLLDEMNLAHPELYFAEFLSKLETRRGLAGDKVPKLPVKIGAGMPEYPLPLGRNVLWTGTMNQDETTKSLSDKVLDRSIIIHFPRPTELKRRVELKGLDHTNRGTLLRVKDWNSWKRRKSEFTEDQIHPFKSFIEQMNDSLSVVGRAIGHRVWQSVEFYMANYPDVRVAESDSQLAKAMHVAFEDQLVQKVMPKLRGIDTRGRSKDECLDKIRGQLVAGIGGSGFNLAEDFDLATELGYGQFIWQTANYLEADDAGITA